MIYLKCFLVGGFICAIAQILMDKFKLIPLYITSLFVFLGSLLTIGGIYQDVVEFGSFGASLPISSFGASLTQAAVDKANEVGYIGILTGMFDTTAPGIIVVIVISFIISFIFKPRG